MKKQDLYNAMGSVGEDLIAKNAMPRVHKQKTIKWKPLVAACLALLLIGGSVSGYAIAVEAAEYREAVAFFEDNQLSTEGLTRDEIKAVYRDIAMKTFSYEKTAEVLNTLSVELYNTDLGELSKDNMEYFWENRVIILHGPSGSQQSPLPEAKNNIRYDVSLCVMKDFGFPETSARPLSYVVFCYDRGELLWKYETDILFKCEGWLTLSDGILVYGKSEHNVKVADGSKTIAFASAMMLDRQGQLVWQFPVWQSAIERWTAITETMTVSEITAAAAGENGEVALFGTEQDGNTLYSLFMLIGKDGTVLKTEKTVETSDVEYEVAVKIGENYLVKTIDSRLVSFSSEGKPIEAKSYFDEDGEYVIRDMLCHKGRIWLSAYKCHTDRSEEYKTILAIEMAYSKAWQENNGKPSFDEKLQEAYTAALRAVSESVLLICDEQGVIYKAYTVRGARLVTGEKIDEDGRPLPPMHLEIDENNNISWHIIRLDEAIPPSPYISSICAEAVVTEFVLTFDSSGYLVEKTELETYSQRIFYFSYNK